MQNDNYLIESERTEKKLTDGLTIDRELMTGMIMGLATFAQAARFYDDIKRHLIYEADVSPEMQQVLAGIKVDENAEDLVLSQGQAETLHATLGMATEVVELIETLMRSAIMGEEGTDKVNIVEELGDLAWYQAMLQRQLGIEQADIYRVNIDKLTKRFPDKFTNDAAINRDVDGERELLEDKVG